MSDKKGESENEKNNVNYSFKFYVVIFCILSALFAFAGLWKEKEITDMGLAVFSTQIVFVLPLFFVFFKKSIASKYALRVKYSMITSFLSSIALIIVGWAIKDKSLIEGAPIGALGVEILSFFILYPFLKK